MYISPSMFPSPAASVAPNWYVIVYIPVSGTLNSKFFKEFPSKMASDARGIYPLCTNGLRQVASLCLCDDVQEPFQFMDLRLGGIVAQLYRLVGAIELGKPDMTELRLQGEVGRVPCHAGT